MQEVYCRGFRVKGLGAERFGFMVSRVQRALAGGA